MAFEWGDLLCFWPFPRGRARPWVRAGNASRDAGDWANAAAYFRRATQIEPRRRAIWVQLGHMEKEAGALPQALAAYRQASHLPACDGDAPFHLGLLARTMGDMATARDAFDQALRENRQHNQAARERLELAHLPAALSPVAIETACALFEHDQSRMNAPNFSTILFDASDLCTYFRHARLPTGIQRVQIEIICKALDDRPDTQICAFLDKTGTWATIPAALFQSLSRMAVVSGDTLCPDWLQAIETLTAVLARAVAPQFAAGMWLINLGTSWQYQNYFLHIRDLQHKHAIRYVPFVHDLIPVMAPQFCADGVVHDFLAWIAGVFDHAFAFLTNSCSTRADLIQVAAQFGHRLDDNRVTVISLDADFRSIQRAEPGSRELKCWGLQSGSYALFVSTIEARKNHVLALKGWAELIRQHGAKELPDLVCVGRNGWLNDEVYRLIQSDPQLGSKVKILSDLSDESLALLYRHSSFTLYPSHYEGWGLPVTESLCYGKVPIISRCSSLPEAGGDLALYVAPDSSADFVAAVETLWFNSQLRKSMEQRICAQFKPRDWGTITRQVGDALLRFDSFVGKQGVAYCPIIRPGRLYRIARHQMAIPMPHANDGESLRFGTGWANLDDDGCRIRPEGGALMATLKAEGTSLWCCLRLHGAQDRSLAGKIVINDRERRFALSAGERHWIALPVEPGLLRIVVRANSEPSGGELSVSCLMVMDTLPETTADLVRSLRLLCYPTLDRL